MAIKRKSTKALAIAFAITGSLAVVAGGFLLWHVIRVSNAGTGPSDHMFYTTGKVIYVDSDAMVFTMTVNSGNKEGIGDGCLSVDYSTVFTLHGNIDELEVGRTVKAGYLIPFSECVAIAYYLEIGEGGTGS